MNRSWWYNCLLLVGGFKHEFYFPFHIWDVILPIDELLFFKMVKTTNQILMQPCMNWINMYKWDIQSQDARYIWGELTHYDSWVPVQHGDGSQDGLKFVAESVITEQLALKALIFLFWWIMTDLNWQNTPVSRFLTNFSCFFNESMCHGWPSIDHAQVIQHGCTAACIEEARDVASRAVCEELPWAPWAHVQSGGTQGPQGKVISWV